MAVLSFDPLYRRTWMFPRNIRRIEPWKLDQILNLLLACQEDTSSQEVQDWLYQELENLNIKRDRNKIKTGNAGGMRTYYSQLELLGLVVRDPSSKIYKPTRAGQKMMNHEDPLKVFRFQLFRLQYPSPYSVANNLRIDPRIKIKPFVFLCDLIKDERLNGLTSDEMAIPVLYGHNNDCFDECVQLILELRKKEYKFEEVINSSQDFYTVKAKNRNFEAGLKDVLDIANTAKNYLQAGQMIFEDPESKRFILTSNPEALNIIDTIGREPIEPFDNNYPESFQNRFGRFDKKKAVKAQTKEKSSKINGFEVLINTLFSSQLSENPYGVDVNSFVKNTAKNYGKSETEIHRIISPLIERRHSIERRVILDAAYSGGVQANLLEKATTEIFKKLGFDKSLWIGSKKAKTGRQGGFPDIYIRASQWDHCALGDSKATAKYKFPIGDTQKLASYYKDCELEIDPNCPSDFFVYVAGGFERDTQVQKYLALCKNNLGKPVSAITVTTLLDLVEQEKKPSLKTIIAKLSQGSYYTSATQF